MSNLLFKACEEGQVETVRELLNQGVSPNIQNEENGRAPLHISKNSEVTQLLMSYGADLNITDYHGNTPLHLTSFCSSHNLVRMIQLLNQGANPNALNNSKITTLHLLMCSYHWNKCLVLEAINLLIKFHAEIDIQNELGESPLYFGVKSVPANKQTTEIIHELLKLGANPNLKTIYETTPFWEVIFRLEDINLMSLMISYGAKIDYAPSDGVTLLHLAASNLNIEIMRKLLENGADPNALDEKKQSPLHSVFQMENEDEKSEKSIVGAIEELVKHGANINVQDEKGKTPLHSAIELNGHTITKALSNLGSDPNIRDKNGKTALEMALANGHKMNCTKSLFFS